jgi:hypothetical protein
VFQESSRGFVSADEKGLNITVKEPQINKETIIKESILFIVCCLKVFGVRLFLYFSKNWD